VFFNLYVFSAARGQTAGPILTSNVSKRVFLGLEQRYHNFRGSNFQKQLKNRPEEAFSGQNNKMLQRQYLQNSKSNQVVI